MANEPWHMLVITCLDPPDVLLESLKPQKMGRSVAIFPRKNDDNLMDVGFQFKHVLQLVVWICLDCQVLQHFEKITGLLLVMHLFYPI